MDDLISGPTIGTKNHADPQHYNSTAHYLDCNFNITSKKSQDKNDVVNLSKTACLITQMEAM
jgi:hypothetical protein